MRTTTQRRRLAVLTAALACANLYCASSDGKRPPAAGKEAHVQRSDSEVMAVYRAWLGKHHEAAEPVAEQEAWKGAWRYFYRPLPDQRRRALEAAVSTASGVLVTGSELGGLHEFLAQPLDARQLAERFAWLSGAMAPVDAGMQWSDARVAKVVTAPALTRGEGGSVTLRFWAVTPPEMEAPYRVEAVAPGGHGKGKPAVTTAGWQEVAGLAAPTRHDAPTDVLNPKF